MLGCELPSLQNVAFVGIWLLAFISAQEGHHFLSGLQMDQAVLANNHAGSWS